jgi:alkanesulfonate monooxygenase SsuD/methylene tetrahydromethanopterin reductase-like flavin-dependent oxidoreductase (luciferase family)
MARMPVRKRRESCVREPRIGKVFHTARGSRLAPVASVPRPLLVLAGTALVGRFFLGVGSGENLNEHITAHRWPPVSVRQEMLEEAVAVIRQLWQAAGLAGRIGDGLMMSERDPEAMRAFDAAAGRGKPRYVEVSV